MNRRELDELVAHYQLPPAQIERAMALARAKPSSEETRQFVVRGLLLAGVLSLAAGVVFFVAANWHELRILGRFVLLEGLLVATLALAFWRPPPRAIGQYALLGAFMIAGALLALFGQTYQTGANVYELFLTWALLGVPLVIAGQWRALWAAWILVLNLALGLFCGLRPETGVFRMLFDGAWATPTLLLIAMLANLALWAIAELLHARANRAKHFAPLAHNAVRRLLLASAIVFATWAGLAAINGFGPYPQRHDGLSALWVFAALVAIGVYTWRRRADVFPLALVAASGIVLVMFAIIENASSGDAGFMAMAFVIAAWLIISSSVSARVILKLMRSWRNEEIEA
jgi:uncharacterized membrane protein